MRKLGLMVGLVFVVFACSEPVGQMLTDGGQMMMDAGNGMLPDAGAQPDAGVSPSEIVVPCDREMPEGIFIYAKVTASEVLNGPFTVFLCDWVDEGGNPTRPPGAPIRADIQFECSQPDGDTYNAFLGDGSGLVEGQYWVGCGSRFQTHATSVLILR